MNDGGMRATFVKSSSWFRRQVSVGAKVGPATWVSVESNYLDFGFRNSSRVMSNLSKSERRFFSCLSVCERGVSLQFQNFVMALSEITNTVEVAGPYTLNVSLAPRFSPLIKRGRPLHEQVPRREFCAHRSAGATNIDLWVDGEIYPRDPCTRVSPTFRTIKQCLEFICLGEDGLLGFCKRLANFGSGLEGANVALEETVRNYQVQMDLLNNRVSVLHAQLQEANGQLQLALETIRGQCLQHQTVIEKGRELERQCGELREKAVGFGNRNEELEELVRTLMEASSANRINELEVEVAHCKQKMKSAESRLSVLKEGPFGLRLRSHHSRGLDELTQDGGQAKRRRKQLRSVLQPAVVDSIHRLNKACKGKKRL